MRNFLYLILSAAMLLSFSSFTAGCENQDLGAIEESPDAAAEAIRNGRQDCPRGRDVTYVSRDSDVCATIRFFCEPGTVGFSNAQCGCGCEPAPEIIGCGGFAGLTCPSGLTCVDDPTDRCDEDCGGADCPGICVVEDTPDPPGLCGGFGGFPCPSGYSCVDSKGDLCSPACGGADCGGICVILP